MAGGNPALPDAERLRLAVLRVTREGDFPASREAVNRILAAAAHPESPARRLAEIVSSDLSLTLRVLKTANSAFFNRSGRPVLSVAQAVAMVGVESISHLASGAPCLEQAARDAPGVRELLGLSLLSAGQAKRLATELQYSRPEDAYVCGLLRNLGEILVALHFPLDYATVIAQTQGDATQTGPRAQQILGYRFEELAVAVLKEWNLGGAIPGCLAATPETVLAAPAGEANLLRRIVTFSHLATAAAFRAPPEVSTARLRELLPLLGPRRSVDIKRVQHILTETVNDAQRQMQALELSADSFRYRRQAEAALEVLRVARSRKPGPSRAARQSRAALLASLEQAVRSPAGFDLTDVALRALDSALLDGLFGRAVLALLHGDGTTLDGKLAVGEDAAELPARFSIPLSVRGGPIATAVLRKQNLILHRETDRPFGNWRLAGFWESGALAIVPLVLRARPVGCVCCDRSPPGMIFTAEDASHLEEIRRLLQMALDRKHILDRTPPAAQAI